MFIPTSRRTALYTAIMCIALPAILSAGGLVDDHQLGKNGWANQPHSPLDNNRPQQNPEREPKREHLPKQQQEEPKRQQIQEQLQPERQLDQRPDEQNRQTRPFVAPSSSKLKDHQENQDRFQPSSDNPKDPPATAPAKVVIKLYTKSIGEMISKNNHQGQPRGHIKLFSQPSSWGPGVKIQDCFGDNVLTKFTIVDQGNIRFLLFQSQAVPFKNSPAESDKWELTIPGNLIKGRYIHLRSKSEAQSAVVTLQVVGTCIDSP